MSKARLIYFAVFAILIAAGASAGAAVRGPTGRTTARRSRVKRARFARRPRAYCADGRLWLFDEPFRAGRRLGRDHSNDSGRAPAQTVALIPGTSDYSPRRRPVSFLVVDTAGRVIASADGAIAGLSRSLRAKPFAGNRCAARAGRVPRRLEGRGRDRAFYVAHASGWPMPGSTTCLPGPIGTARDRRRSTTSS